MTVFLFIAAVGLVYAACMYEPHLFWFLGVGALAQIFYNLLQTSREQNKDQDVMKNFFAEFKDSPYSKLFDTELAREKIQEMSNLLCKSLYRSLENELYMTEDETYSANLQFLMIDIRQKITDQQIEAYRYCKRKKEGNYANIYASSLKLPLYKEELRDKEVLNIVNQFSDAELVFTVLDIPSEILNSTSEHTCGREEEMEACYHNNLRRIEFLLRNELAKRFLTA